MTTGQTATVPVSFQDQYGNVVITNTATNLYLYSSSSDTKFSSSTLTISAGASGTTFSFQQMKYTATPVTITLSDNATAPDGASGLVDATGQVTINTGTIDKFVITPVSQTLTAGTESQAFQIETQNQYGIPTAQATDLTVYLTSDGNYEFSAQPSPNWIKITQLTLPANQTNLTLYYKNTLSGTHTITVSDANPADGATGIKDASATVAVNPQNPVSMQLVKQIGTGSAGQVVGPYELIFNDQYGNQANLVNNTTINLTSDFSNGAFYQTADGVNSVSSVTVSAGQSGVAVYFKSQIAQSGNLTFGSDFGLVAQPLVIDAGTLSSISLTVSNVNYFTGDKTSPINFSFLNNFGVPIAQTGDTTVNFSTTSASGKFDISTNGLFDGTIVAITIPAGQTGGSFYYTDTKAEASTINVSAQGKTSNNLNLVFSAGPLDHFSFLTNPQTVTQGVSSGIMTIQGYDKFNNAVSMTGDVDLSLTSESLDASFSTSSTSWTGTGSLVFPKNAQTLSFYYKDNIVGVKNIFVNSALGIISQTETVTAKPIVNAQATQLLFQTAPQTLIKDDTGIANFYLADGSGNYISATQAVTVSISSSDSNVQFLNDQGQWVSALSITINAGETLKSFSFKGSAVGSPVISISATGLAGASQTETIIVGIPAKIAIISVDSSNVNTWMSITVQVQTTDGIPVKAGSNIGIKFTASPDGTMNSFSAGYPWSPLSGYNFTINANSSESKIYFKRSQSGTVSLNFSDNNSLGWSASKNIAFIDPPTALSFASAAQTKLAGEDSNLITVQLKSSSGATIATPADLNLYLSSNSASGQFSQNTGSNWSAISTIIMPAGQSEVSFYYHDTVAGNWNIKATDQSGQLDTGYIDTNQAFVINSAEVSNFYFITSSQTLELNQTSSPITIQARDQYGNVKNVDSDLSIYLYSTLSGQFSADNTFTNLITTLKIPTGKSTQSFYYRNVGQTGTDKIIVSDKNPLDNPDQGIINATQDETIITGSATKLLFENMPAMLSNGDPSNLIKVKLSNSSGAEIPVDNALGTLTVNLTTSSSNGHFATDINGSWSVSTLSIPIGSSNASFYYKDFKAGNSLVTASGVFLNTGPALVSASGYISIGDLPPSKIVFTTTVSSVIANHPTTKLEIETRNKWDNPTVMTADKIIYLRTNSATGSFSLDGIVWSSNAVVIPKGSSSTSFYYKDATAGVTIITAADNLPINPDTDMTNAVANLTIQPQVVSKLKVVNISDPQIQGNPSSMVVMAVDSDDYIVPSYAGTLDSIKAYDQSTNKQEDAFLPNTSYTFNPATDKGIKTFQNGVAFYKTGKKTVEATTKDGLIGKQADITVLASSGGEVKKIAFVPGTKMLLDKNVETQMLVQLQDANGNSVANDLIGGYPIKVVTDSKTAEFSLDGVHWSSSSQNLVVPRYLSFVYFYYRDGKTGDYQLEASDQIGGQDSSLIDNGKLDVEIASGPPAYLQITGNSTQQAGQSQQITIAVKDSEGNTVKSFQGENAITFTGANTAISGDKPICQDKNGKAIEFGLPVNLDFSSGVATAQMTLYLAENAQIEASYNANIISNNSTDTGLAVVVSPGNPSGAKSLLDVAPNPQKTGANVALWVTPKDFYENVINSSALSVVLGISGVNPQSGINLIYDSQSLKYSGSYLPQKAGIDQISGKINNETIGQDTDGKIDGIYNEIIEGIADSTVAVTTNNCDYLNIDSHTNNQMILSFCFDQKNDQSVDIDSKKDGGTGLEKIELKNNAGLTKGILTMEKLNEWPKSVSNKDIYLKSPYVFYRYIQFKQDMSSGSLNSISCNFRIDKNWISDNAITETFSIGTDKKANNFNYSNGNACAKNCAKLNISVNTSWDYIFIGGKKEVTVAQNTSNTTTNDSNKKEKPAVVEQQQISDNPLINNGDSQKNAESNINNSNNVNSLKPAFLENYYGKNYLGIFGGKDMATATAILAAAGAAAASAPSLGMILSSLRTLTAVSVLGKKKKQGMVYDAETGKPIFGAMVGIISENGKSREMKTTDKNGGYAFLVPAGEYRLIARKFGYETFASWRDKDKFNAFYEGYYTEGEIIKVTNVDGGEVVSVNIPMKRKEFHIFNFRLNTETILIWLFFLGFIFSLWSAFAYVSKINLIIVAIYFAMIIFRLLTARHKNWSRLKMPNGTPASFATVFFFEKNEDEKLVARTIADEQGRFVLFLDAGEYMMEVKKDELIIKKSLSLIERRAIDGEFILE